MSSRFHKNTDLYNDFIMMTDVIDLKKDEPFQICTTEIQDLEYNVQPWPVSNSKRRQYFKKNSIFRVYFVMSL